MAKVIVTDVSKFKDTVPFFKINQFGFFEKGGILFMKISEHLAFELGNAEGTKSFTLHCQVQDVDVSITYKLV